MIMSANCSSKGTALSQCALVEHKGPLVSLRKTLIGGFGHELLGDDGFGVEIARRLAARKLPPHIQTIDVGIAGLYFVLELMDGFDAVIVVDAMKGGQPPGTLYVFTPGTAEGDLLSQDYIDPHVAEPAQALKLARALGLLPADVTVVGCEPASCRLGMPLSVWASAAVDRAVQTIQAMVVGERPNGARTLPDVASKSDSLTEGGHGGLMPDL
jgi:hydrogenase maturation protease